MTSFADACREARALAREAVRALPPTVRAAAFDFVDGGRYRELATRHFILARLQKIPKAERQHSLDALVEMVKEALKHIAAARVAKRYRGRRFGAAAAPDRPIAVYPGTPRERLDAAVRSAVTDACQLRCGAAGGSSFAVELVGRVTDVDYKVLLTKAYPYAGTAKTRAARHDAHTVRVLRSWRRDVLRRGLAGSPRHFVLHAEPMAIPGAPAHVETFFAIWAAQGPGYAVETVHGLIARRVGGRDLAFGRLESSEDMRQGAACRKAIKQAAKFRP